MTPSTALPGDGLAGSAGALPRATPRPQARTWFGGAVTCIVLIYGYLYICMFGGAPFSAFDHENYIAFLEDPYPFFFEPGYTALAYLLSATVSEDSRFPLVFLLFTLPPLLVIWHDCRRRSMRPNAALLFAIILTKAFYIGFIAQRFFFAELWVAALVIHHWNRKVPLWQSLLPSAAHFSALTILPTLQWFRSPLNWRKTLAGAGLLLSVYLYLRLLSTFELLGYDYSRYADSDDSGVGLLSLVQMAVLGLICAWSTPRRERGNFLVLVVLVFMIKVLFADIEVFSRIFQLQVDLILLYAGIRAKRGWGLLYLYALGFALLQIFAAPRSSEVFVYHGSALLNALRSMALI